MTRLWVVLISLLSFAGCLKDRTGIASVEDEPRQELLPLKVGNEWTYRAYLGHSPEHESLEHWTVIGKVGIAGVEYYHLSVDGEWHSDMLVRSDSSGLWMFGYASETDLLGNGLYLRFPAADGEMYEYPDSLIEMPEYYDGWITMRVSRLTEDYDSNSYEAYAYSWLDLLIDTPIYYFVPNIGLVAGNSFYIFQSGAHSEYYIRRELLSYDLK